MDGRTYNSYDICVLSELFDMRVIIIMCSRCLIMFKSVSMRKPGRTRQEVIQLKSPILLKLGINVGFGE